MQSEFLKSKVKLSKRLSALMDLVKNGNEEVYDLCCDHGDLGIRIAQEQLGRRVFLIDKVPSIMRELELTLEATDIPTSVKVFTSCEDASKSQINLKNSTAIIAGIGESTAISIIDKIAFCPTSELVLGIHSENFNLRSYLIKIGLKLMQEKVIEDKGKYYEILKVSPSGSKMIDPVGSEQWTNENTASLELLRKRIQYLTKKLSHGKDEKYEDFLKRLKLRAENLS